MSIRGARGSRIDDPDGDAAWMRAPCWRERGRACRTCISSRAEAAQEWAARAAGRFVFEYGEPGLNGAGGPDMEMMKSVKQLFDPHQLLNPGRLYGRI